MTWLQLALICYLAIGLAIAIIFTTVLIYGHKRLDGRTRLQVDYMIVRFGKTSLIIGLFLALMFAYPAIIYMTIQHQKRKRGK